MRSSSLSKTLRRLSHSSSGDRDEAETYSWTVCQQIILTILHGKQKVGADERTNVCNSIRELATEQLGPLLLDFSKNQLLPQGMQNIAAELTSMNGDCRGLALLDVWTNFYQNTLFDLHSVLVPLQGYNPQFDIKRTTLTAFRNDVLLKILSDLETADLPPSNNRKWWEMLTVLDMCCRDGSDKANQLSKYLPYVIPNYEEEFSMSPAANSISLLVNDIQEGTLGLSTASSKTAGTLRSSGSLLLHHNHSLRSEGDSRTVLLPGGGIGKSISSASAKALLKKPSLNNLRHQSTSNVSSANNRDQQSRATKSVRWEEMYYDADESLDNNGLSNHQINGSNSLSSSAVASTVAATPELLRRHSVQPQFKPSAASTDDNNSQMLLTT